MYPTSHSGIINLLSLTKFTLFHYLYITYLKTILGGIYIMIDPGKKSMKKKKNNQIKKTYKNV